MILHVELLKLLEEKTCQKDTWFLVFHSCSDVNRLNFLFCLFFFIWFESSISVLRFKQLLLSSPAHQVYSLAQLVLYIYVFVTRQAMLKPPKSVEPVCYWRTASEIAWEDLTVNHLSSRLTSSFPPRPEPIRLEINDISIGDEKTVQCPPLGPRYEWLSASALGPSALSRARCYVSFIY